MLIDYLKRSALQTMSFYEQRFGLARQDLAALLLSLQTMASVRSAQHANILNKLILVLTVVSAGLALMQVLSSTSLWIGLNPGLIGVLLTLMFFLIMVSSLQKGPNAASFRRPFHPPKPRPRFRTRRGRDGSRQPNRERIGEAPNPGPLHCVDTDCLTHVVHMSVPSCRATYGSSTSFPAVSRPASAVCAARGLCQRISCHRYAASESPRHGHVAPRRGVLSRYCARSAT